MYTQGTVDTDRLAAAQLLWGKMPMQDDPIHLRCDNALATNRDIYSSILPL